MAAPYQLVGHTVSHYRILEQIGAGGMGVVYRAHDERLDRDVALKVLPAGALSDENSRKRFRTEALALSRLNYPNIETVHDFDTQDGVDFLIVELIPGIGLDSKLATGAMLETEVARLGIQLAEGLSWIGWYQRVGALCRWRRSTSVNNQLLPDGVCQNGARPHGAALVPGYTHTAATDEHEEDCVLIRDEFTSPTKRFCPLRSQRTLSALRS